jgi:probable HAF family extracellular repeat protein
VKTTHCAKARNFLVAATALIASLGFAVPVFADTAAILNPDGKLTYLDVDNATVSRINDAGQVTGNIDGQGFITGPNGVGMTDLGSPGGFGGFASAINNAGQVAGTFVTDDYPFGSYHAFITGPNGVGMTELSTNSLFGTSFHVGIGGINDAGQVVGWSDTADGSRHAFITGPNGMGMTDLGTLGGSYTVAAGINDSGQVVGWSDKADGSQHAFITGPDGMGMTDLGTVGGADTTATGINNAGQVVGYSVMTDGSQHAFITGPDGVGMTDLGTLGGFDSRAFGINDAGQVVGYSDTTDGSQHAFITGPNGMGMTDLNSLVANLGSGAFIETANGINNHGQVIVTIDGVPAVPEPETYAMLLAGLALIGIMARQHRFPARRASRSVLMQIALLSGPASKPTAHPSPEHRHANNLLR